MWLCEFVTYTFSISLNNNYGGNIINIKPNILN